MHLPMKPSIVSGPWRGFRISTLLLSVPCHCSLSIFPLQRAKILWFSCFHPSLLLSTTHAGTFCLRVAVFLGLTSVFSPVTTKQRTCYMSLSGVVVNALAFWLRGLGFEARPRHYILLGSNLGQVVYSQKTLPPQSSHAPRNWGYKKEYSHWTDLTA